MLHLLWLIYNLFLLSLFFFLKFLLFNDEIPVFRLPASWWVRISPGHVSFIFPSHSIWVRSIFILDIVASIFSCSQNIIHFLSSCQNSGTFGSFLVTQFFFLFSLSLVSLSYINVSWWNRAQREKKLEKKKLSLGSKLLLRFRVDRNFPFNKKILVIYATHYHNAEPNSIHSHIFNWCREGHK